MYRSDGGRHTLPHDVPLLPGWQGSKPVHVGNPAADQFQPDIYGEVLDSLHLCQLAGIGDRPWDMAIEENSSPISRGSGSSQTGASGSRAAGAGRMLGNFPQALSHLAVINTALALCGPIHQRGGG
jgi:GH15 family glucan-1,4-alpha-glucosidase